VTRFVSLRPVGVLLVAVAVLVLPERASAGERPYFSRGTAQFVSPTGDFVGAGNATHLGLYEERGNATISDTGAIDGWATYTAANGDQLYATIAGQLNGRTGAITATVTYVGGTGRFADADGSAGLAGQILPDGTIAVTVEGTINY
jgi:hypothetical protein